MRVVLSHGVVSYARLNKLLTNIELIALQKRNKAAKKPTHVHICVHTCKVIPTMSHLVDTRKMFHIQWKPLTNPDMLKYESGGDQEEATKP